MPFSLKDNCPEATETEAVTFLSDCYPEIGSSHPEAEAFRSDILYDPSYFLSANAIWSHSWNHSKHDCRSRLDLLLPLVPTIPQGCDDVDTQLSMPWEHQVWKLSSGPPCPTLPQYQFPWVMGFYRQGNNVCHQMVFSCSLIQNLLCSKLLWP